MTAEDIAVESLMYYWENRGKLKEHTNIPAYVLTVVKHKCLDYLRHLRIQEDFADTLQSNEIRKQNLRIATLEACNPEKIFSEELQYLVNKALVSLPEQTRDILSGAAITIKVIKKLLKPWGFQLRQLNFI